MRPLILVACCGQKLAQPSAARDLYISPLFKKSRTWAERHGDWLILSALHGVVDPERVIEPYDATLAKMPAAQRRLWSERVADALIPHAHRKIVALVGVAYLGWQGPRFPHVSTPLEGLGIGRRLAWLERENRL